MFEILDKLLLLCGVMGFNHGFVDFGLGDVVVPAKVGDLGAEGVGCSVKPGNVDRNNGMDVGEGSGHFSNFFEDDVMS